MTGINQIIATADEDKIVYNRQGSVMWTRARFQNGILVDYSRMRNYNVLKEINRLDGWNIEKISK